MNSSQPVNTKSPRQGALHGLARITAILAACAAILPGAQAADKARVSVGATVIPVLRLTVLNARESVQVPALATRGAGVAVPNAATIEVHSNQDRYAVHFEIVDADVTSVEVDGLQAPVLVGPAGRTVFVTGETERRSVKTLSYRVRYGDGVAAGTRGAPLKLYLQNI